MTINIFVSKGGLNGKIVVVRFFFCWVYIYVQRKVRIGTIPELYLRIVRIPTLSADSGIVPDNSRIAQGVFYRFLL